jgi:LmbE family N-acetylglucosaminyl deacetylase
VTSSRLRQHGRVPYTLVSFHAHPDDEVLYTGGTLARAAAEGHRVVLVTATAGEAGLAAGEFTAGAGLGERRRAELEGSARALGVARLVLLGYADSGLDVRTAAGPGGPPFAEVDVEQAAARLAAVLRQESADVLTVYDPAGGYGHPDHVQVHRVGVRAAELAGTPVVLEATVDRDLLRRVLSVVGRLPGLPAGFDASAVDGRYTARERITHRVDVRAQAGAKRTAMRAHRSQAGADSGARTLGVLLRLPRPLFRRVLGTEWFVERGRTPAAPLDDVFATLR